MTPKYPEVVIKANELDGNAFAIMGAVSKALRRANASSDDIAQYQEEAMSGNHDNLIRVSMKWVTFE